MDVTALTWVGTRTAAFTETRAFGGHLGIGVVVTGRTGRVLLEIQRPTRR